MTMSITKLVDRLDDNQLGCLMTAINHYGSGQHPMATPDSVRQFNPFYVMYCLGQQSYDYTRSAPLEKAEEVNSIHEHILEILNEIY